MLIFPNGSVPLGNYWIAFPSFGFCPRAPRGGPTFVGCRGSYSPCLRIFGGPGRNALISPGAAPINRTSSPFPSHGLGLCPVLPGRSFPRVACLPDLFARAAELHLSLRALDRGFSWFLRLFYFHPSLFLSSSLFAKRDLGFPFFRARPAQGKRFAVPLP